MTDAELAPLAKAGDRAAVNELLRRNVREATRMVCRRLWLLRRGYLADEAPSMAFRVLWDCIADWSPETCTLLTFARRPLLWAVDDVIATLAAPTLVPAATTSARARHARRPRSLDEPDADGNPRGNGLAAPPVDVAAFLDAHRILTLLKPRDADYLLRVAQGETLTEIAAAEGVSRERGRQVYDQALRRARDVAKDTRINA